MSVALCTKRPPRRLQPSGGVDSTYVRGVLMADNTESWHGTSSGYGYHRCRCDKCKAGQRERQRAYRANNPRSRDYQREYQQRNAMRIAERQREYRLRRVNVLAAHKARPCADCGIQYPPYVMQFDHRDPESKQFTISDMRGLSLERLVQEIAKCDVVCANCHMERTHGTRWRAMRLGLPDIDFTEPEPAQLDAPEDDEADTREAA